MIHPPARAVTRLTPPPLPAGFVRREHLADRRSGPGGSRFAVVRGLPGSGKTTLVSDWVSEMTPADVAWLRCDALDSDPDEWWTSFGAALKHADPDNRARLVMPAGTAHAATVLAWLHGREGPLVVVVDDAHLAGAALAELAPVIERAPARTRFVIVSRTVLPAAFRGIEGRGDTRAIGPMDLRCSPEETAKVLEALGHRADGDIAGRVAQWSGGWLGAIVLLARLSGVGDAVADRVVTPSLVLDYVHDELLSVVDDGLRLFLEQMSVMAGFGPRDAVALFGAGAAQQIRRALALHTVGEVDGGERRRVHPIVAEAIRSRMTADRRRQTDVLAATRLRQIGDVAQAAVHFLDAGDLGSAIELIGAHGPMLYIDHGLPAIDAWLSRLDPSLARTDPSGRAQALLAWARHVLGDRDQTVLWLEAGAAASAPARDALALMALVRCGEHMADADPDACLAVYERSRRAGLDVPTATHLFALRAATWRDDPAGAAGHESTHAACHPLSTLEQRFSDSLRSMSAAAHGDLVGAERLAGRALQGADEFGWQAHPGFVDATRAMGIVHYERDQLEEAMPWLERAARPDRARSPSQVVLGELAIGRCALAAGEIGAAAAALRRGRGALRLDSASPVADFVTAFEIRLMVAAHDRQRAVRLLDWVRSPWRRARLAARLHLRDADPDAARRILDGVEAPPTARARLDGLILTARIEQLSGETDAAAHTLAAATALAAPQRMVRPFLEDGPQLRALAGVAPGRDGAWSPFTGQTARASAGRRHRRSSTASEQRPLPQLSPRELAVLRLVAARLSSREIAGHLDISPNTLKTHLRAVYRKVGVESRAAAEAAARQLGLE